MDDLGDDHLECPLHVRARLGGDHDMVEQVQGVEETSRPGGRDAPLLHQVGFRTAKEDGHILRVNAADLNPLFQGIEGGWPGRVVEADRPLRPEGAAGQYEPEVVLPPKVPELQRHWPPLVRHLLHVELHTGVMHVFPSKFPVTNLRMRVVFPTPQSLAIITFKTSTDPSIMGHSSTRLPGKT